MKIRTMFFVLFITTAVALAACGQKGPLYLPEETPEAKTENETEANPR